ncbi:hypothetical protein BN990_01847 [Virgibacillus salexigens]|uniref:Uncharacterized protein n=1 Tax=Virgibacillus massiliensis TaxID=1462526 RepID=A0A024QBB9_9BACI|nr:hypothetical protein BN990_01847 [Virgibacillus massiliensis]
MANIDGTYKMYPGVSYTIVTHKKEEGLSIGYTLNIKWWAYPIIFWRLAVKDQKRHWTEYPELFVIMFNYWIWSLRNGNDRTS